jgi:hypothetical protein
MKTVRQRPGELSAIERIKLCNQFINGGIKIIEGSDWYHLFACSTMLKDSRFPLCSIENHRWCEEAVMRGVDHQQSGMFSYISAERRVPKDHPLRAIRVMVDAALKESSWRFDAVYASSGRPSIPPEKLLRALLLQVLYTVRSERLLMEQLDYNFLFRWFVGLNIDDPVAGGSAKKLFDCVITRTDGLP